MAADCSLLCMWTTTRACPCVRAHACVRVVTLRAVSDVVGTHPEAKEHSVSRWLSRNMNVMKSHACNQHEESQVSAPHVVVSNTPLMVVHKSLNGMLSVMGPARLLQSVGT